jgi:hypothetical protein
MAVPHTQHSNWSIAGLLDRFWGATLPAAALLIMHAMPFEICPQQRHMHALMLNIICSFSKAGGPAAGAPTQPCI